ncbi:M23 family metallopeptidase [Candidatus Parcubacteria bacterium]|nr:M23 family metallopeptidase [Candidatus Parcubacteria bacterium]
MEAYARDYEEKDMELLNIPQRKIQDVVVAYRYQETLDESKRWVGRWWNARPYKDVDLNPRLMARLRLTMEEDGTYGCFPLKTPRRPVVYSPFAVRNSQGAKYCEETGTFERGGHADMDGYKPDKHEGIDIPFGDDKTPPIHAWRSGVVVYSGYNASKKWRNGRLVSSGYGNIIIIRHTEADTTDEGKILPLVSAYAHLSRRDVEVGDVVEICDVIGLGGSSGGVPPHLHFEIRYGDMPLDPEAFLNLREKDDNSFRNYHIGTPLFGMSGGDYVIFALGDCPKNKFACDWTYTTAPSFACKDVGKDKSPKTNGIVLTKYTKP